MKNKRPLASFAPHEIQRFIYPITLSFICIITGVILTHLINDAIVKIPLVIYGICVLIYFLINNNLKVCTPNYRDRYGSVNSILSAVGLGLFVYLSTDDLREASHLLILLGFIAIAVVSGRFHS